ncbi:hypothetical protein VNO80_29933 [Phaseolus coccineus]|uniref:Plastocyanin-like domain-containing protein n=1 Tax=Phaseolus coccineus TaxID=3886 RepID=A0AAN9QIZ5_PHACN
MTVVSTDATYTEPFRTTFHFFVVGSGFHNFNPTTHGLKFNFVDPHVRNTIGTPPGEWVAIHFVADNPGSVLYYCKTLLLLFVPESHINLFHGFLPLLEIGNLVHPLLIDSHLNWGLGMALLVENGVGLSQSPPPHLPQC